MSTRCVRQLMIFANFQLKPNHHQQGLSTVWPTEFTNHEARRLANKRMTGMATSKHTPGPWHVIRDKDSVRVESLSLTSRKVVCYIYGNRAKEKAEEDARLISAAPDFLSVAKRILNHSLIRLTGDVESDLIAAIAKVEGR